MYYPDGRLLTSQFPRNHKSGCIYPIHLGPSVSAEFLIPWYIPRPPGPGRICRVSNTWVYPLNPYTIILGPAIRYLPVILGPAVNPLLHDIGPSHSSRASSFLAQPSNPYFIIFGLGPGHLISHYHLGPSHCIRYQWMGPPVYTQMHTHHGPIRSERTIFQPGPILGGLSLSEESQPWVAV
ncbi:hypothetical protein P692DRAFT_201809339 [Suillus brevipes Sb2]|nr:hypothetical protein P692DRAFT_201809339 [Suillus brevipes Sb2]